MSGPDAIAAARRRFVDLHRSGCFVIPNPWDVGSAVRLERMGFAALATTSSGLAWSLGKEDQEVTLDELETHVAALVAAVTVPVHVDAERCFADTADGVAATVERLAAVGASGVSIEDWSPALGRIEEAAAFVPRVAAAAETAHRHGMVLTARHEAHLYGDADVEATVERLRAYRSAGADVVYAPGPTAAAELSRLIAATEAPVNVLLRPGSPSVAELAAMGARRLSTGGALARAAYGALEERAATLLDPQSGS